MDNTTAIAALQRAGWSDVRTLEPAAAVGRLEKIYQTAIDGIRTAVGQLTSGTPAEQVDVSWNYPGIAFAVGASKPETASWAACGFCRRGPGLYVATAARMDIFGAYWLEQITAIAKAHGVLPMVGISDKRVPANLGLDGVGERLPADVDGFFPRISLDEIADSANAPEGMFPLSLYSGAMSDFCLSRLQHYTGTQPRHFQQFILLTNYGMYMDAFAALAQEVLANPQSGYTEFVTPEHSKGPSYKQPQMPAYHLKRPDNLGITLININVGPSNALNIVRNLCALRPHALLMVGHCGGLRPTQTIGGFVLADGYYREDGILDELLPREIPVPPVAEINIALKDAIQETYGVDKEHLREIVETGTVASVADRGWELRPELMRRIVSSRALAIDMETATIAAAGFLYRVPYGTLLCVSDLPLHGKPKNQGIAHAFYERSVDAHLKTVMRAVEIMREHPGRLHSRRLRGVDDPPVR